MGIGYLFGSDVDFSEFIEEQPLNLKDAVHQATIKVDEGGTVATAATRFRSYKSSSTGFICNRPFMFLIHDEKSKEILFSGVYRGPDQ